MKKSIITAAVILTFGQAALATAANLVSNPGFETGDFSGWTLSGTDYLPGGNDNYYGVDSMDAHNGSYGTYFGPVGGVLNLTQTIATTPGTSYQISFWLAQAPATPPTYVNSFAVSFSGANLFTESPAPESNYTQYTFEGTAPSAASQLQFSFRNDTGFFSLDDVSVSTSAPSAIPEPATFLLVLPALALVLRWRSASSRQN
ncbi:MAG: carbohydrate binding domain-containing protein [Acidobacteriaceae bacterium]|nr:carbohydrate binding domain-containing protein [Acidobacteriaceae bacterium]